MIVVCKREPSVGQYTIGHPYEASVDKVDHNCLIVTDNLGEQWKVYRADFEPVQVSLWLPVSSSRYVNIDTGMVVSFEREGWIGTLESPRLLRIDPHQVQLWKTAIGSSHADDQN